MTWAVTGQLWLGLLAFVSAIGFIDFGVPA